MNRAVALARRTRHHGDTGAEQIVTAEIEVSVTATEQSREQAFEFRVHSVKGFFEPRTCLAVDLADRAFKRFEGLCQVL